jgi:hypothetical protein
MADDGGRKEGTACGAIDSNGTTRGSSRLLNSEGW